MNKELKDMIDAFVNGNSKKAKKDFQLHIKQQIAKLQSSNQQQSVEEQYFFAAYEAIKKELTKQWEYEKEALVTEIARFVKEQLKLYKGKKTK